MLSEYGRWLLLLVVIFMVMGVLMWGYNKYSEYKKNNKGGSSASSSTSSNNALVDIQRWSFYPGQERKLELCPRKFTRCASWSLSTNKTVIVQVNFLSQLQEPWVVELHPPDEDKNYPYGFFKKLDGSKTLSVPEGASEAILTAPENAEKDTLIEGNLEIQIGQ